MYHRKKLPRRQGTILVLFAMLIFALMAMAALAVDMGLLIDTQRQMQSAVDSSALEGLRWRDNSSASALLNPAQSGISQDQVRRQLASDLATRVFDYRLRSDGDRTNPPLSDNSYDPMQVGAGPVMVYSGGVTQAYALQLVQVPSQPFDHVYKPSGFSRASAAMQFQALQLNSAGNLQHGDLVAGSFMTNPSYPASNPALEDNQYNRRDFVPAPFSGTPATAPAFLARMRRTNNFQGLDNVSGVSSLGPALPFLFARGSLITASQDPTQNPNNYNPRRDGLTVRATAIANATPAKTVGPAYPPDLFPNAPASFAGIQGVAPFALSLAYWNTLAGQTTPDQVSVQANGQIATSTGSGQMIRIASLVNAVGVSDSSMQVASASGFPASASPFVPFLVRIDNELLRVTAVDATQLNWTVERGQAAEEGTPVTAHAAGAPVQLHQSLTIAQALIGPAGISSPQPTSAPDLIAAPSPATSSAPVANFVPLFDDSTQLIVGFGPVTWSVVTPWSPPTMCKLSITRTPPPAGATGTVAAQNASAVFARSLPASLINDPNGATKLAAVLATNATLSGALQTAALVHYVKP
jgi:hypothetical protein